MAKFKTITILLILSSIISAQQKEIIAYYPEFRSQGQIFYVKDLEKNGTASKLTVINYAFVEPAPDSSGNIIPKFINSFSAYKEIIPSGLSIDGLGDRIDQPLRGQFNQLRKLKEKHPHLKILLSIGGWAGSKYFSDLALTDSSREKFADTCIEWFIKGNLPVENNAGGKGSAAGLFSGFDLDWEFPVKGGMEGNHYNPKDKENLTALFALFRKKLDEIDPGFLLTAAISARASEFWKYDFEKDQRYLDWYNVMTYDFHGSWEPRTGHHTNLLSSPEDPDWEKESLDHTIKFLLDSAGVDKNKIVPGAAFYGKSWINADTSKEGLYQPAQPDTIWNRIRFNDYLYFSEANHAGFKCYWDNFSMAAWLYNSEGKIFYTYDDIRSVALKSRYVDAYGLRGLMFWEITGDDTSGNLVNTIYTGNMPDIKSKTNNGYNTKISKIKLFADSVISAGSNVIIQPGIKESDTTIVKVEYFIDASSIGYNTKFPFIWIWFNAEEGKHKISAEITDKSGIISITLPEEFIVNKNK
ncbi:MAG TPA: glycoside hydrolase family 18 protein [Ignavibacteriaceae bacterium]|nr:glycoside hydrolase family 18 protein [Ignavibacteriaceae bacterium]